MAVCNAAETGSGLQVLSTTLMATKFRSRVWTEQDHMREFKMVIYICTNFIFVEKANLLHISTCRSRTGKKTLEVVQKHQSRCLFKDIGAVEILLCRPLECCWTSTR